MIPFSGTRLIDRCSGVSVPFYTHGRMGAISDGDPNHRIKTACNRSALHAADAGRSVAKDYI